MGIHSDSIYKDTQQEVEAKKVDTEQVVGKDAENNTFAKLEDTPTGGKLSLYDETGTEIGRLSLHDAGQLMIDSPAGGERVRLKAGGSLVATLVSNRLEMSEDLQMGDNIIKDPSNAVANDNMTADPETDTEDGYIEVDIGGTIYQIPIYSS